MRARLLGWSRRCSGLDDSPAGTVLPTGPTRVVTLLTWRGISVLCWWSACGVWLSCTSC